ncbi:MAG: SUMF1/EgtB/PvdO family nonheme iron enzyme [Treponema sp.]|jgi:hypothetical protein|nr:SUMF1/EgtB/PvdO family nonheme iron enzyme [Treponema sp.]
MKMKKDDDPDQVKLKPFMGIRPGVYLTVIYSIILLAIIFFFLVFPGIKNTQVALIVKTEPAGAAIRVNDVYMGLAGTRIFIPKGTYTIEVVMPGFESQSSIHEIPGRIFGSRYFPRTYKIEKTLKTADPMATFAIYAFDFAAWTFGGEATEAWQIPLSLSEGVYRVGELSAADRETFADMLLAASRFAVTQAALRDLIRAKALFDQNGNAPSPVTLLGTISDVLVFLSENPGTISLLSQLPHTSVRTISETDVNTSFIPDNTQSPLMQGGRSYELAGLTFRSMIAGKLHKSGKANYLKPLGQYIDINSFMISDTPVPRSLFGAFLRENPEWREHQTDHFPGEISNSPLETYNRFIYGATWYAAQAFCKWLTGRLPSSLAHLEIRLPTEDEWEYASLSVSSMQNAGWEWCADPFAPLHFIKANSQAMEDVGSPERSLRGRQTAVSAVTRASLPPEFSSPFVTFRPVIAERR